MGPVMSVLDQDNPERQTAEKGGAIVNRGVLVIDLVIDIDIARNCQCGSLR
jgi:hypothetical protein